MQPDLNLSEDKTVVHCQAASLCKAGIPQGRHRLRLARHVRYARFPREDPREEIVCVGRKTSRVWLVGVCVRVGAVEFQFERGLFLQTEFRVRSVPVRW